MTMRTTPDGRWTYGTGQYDKKISDYLGVNAPSPATSISGKLAELFAPGTTKVVSSLTYGLIAPISIPVFYIWAKGPDAVKRIVEWPFAKHVRDNAFGPFTVTMDGLGTNDLARVSTIAKLQASTSPSLSTMANLAGAEKLFLTYDEVEQRVRNTAADAAAAAVLPIVVGGVIAVAALVFFHAQVSDITDIA